MQSEIPLIELLNREELNIIVRDEIILKQECVFESLASVPKAFWKTLLDHNKVKPDWLNMIKYFEINGHIDADLVRFINDSNNIDALTNTPVASNITVLQPFETAFCEALCMCNDFLLEVYAKLVKSIPVYFPSLDITQLSKEKEEILIRSHKLQFTVENYEALKTKGHYMHIIFIEEHIDEFVETDTKDWNLDSNDYYQLFISENVMLKHKLDILSGFDEELITRESNLPKTILAVLNKANKSTHSVLMDKIFSLLTDSQDKLDLLALYIGTITTEKLTEFLESMGEPFANIPLHRTVYIQRTLMNRHLVSEMKRRQFIGGWTEKDNQIKINGKRK